MVNNGPIDTFEYRVSVAAVDRRAVESHNKADVVAIRELFDGSIVLASYDGTSEMDISGAAITDLNIEDFIQAADFAISDMTSAATNLGAAKSRIDLQNDFIGKLMDSIDRGISALVDADMNEESTRLQALQVQQQLGIQALSIANSSSQNVLALFR